MTLRRVQLIFLFFFFYSWLVGIKYSSQAYEKLLLYKGQTSTLQSSILTKINNTLCVDVSEFYQLL